MEILTPKPVPLLIGLFSFFIVFGVLAKMLLPRINKALADRADAIEGRLERAEAIAAEAADTLRQYQLQLAEARHEAARTRQEAAEQGAMLLAEIRAEGLREREATVTAAHEQLAAHRALAEAELRDDVASLAIELAGRIVGEPLDETASTSKTVSRFLAEVDAHTAGASETATS